MIKTYINDTRNKHKLGMSWGPRPISNWYPFTIGRNLRCLCSIINLIEEDSEKRILWKHILLHWRKIIILVANDSCKHNLKQQNYRVYCNRFFYFRFCLKEYSIRIFKAWLNFCVEISRRTTPIKVIVFSNHWSVLVAIVNKKG